MRTGVAVVALGAGVALLTANMRPVRAEGTTAMTAGEAAERLDRVKSSPALSDDPVAIDSLARDLGAFPPGPVQVEARLFVAEAWLGRMNRPDEAIALLHAVSEDPETDPLTARLAEREIVDTLTDEGRLDEAVAEAAAHPTRLDVTVVKRAHTLVRRRAIRDAAFGILAAFVALAGASLVRAFSRGRLRNIGGALTRFLPVAIAFTVYLAGAGGVLASRYETGNAAPFVGLGLAVFPLVLLARAWSVVGSGRALARAGRAGVCAVGVFAAAFLLLDTLDPTYLDGFGL